MSGLIQVNCEKRLFNLQNLGLNRQGTMGHSSGLLVTFKEMKLCVLGLVRNMPLINPVALTKFLIYALLCPFAVRGPGD